MHAMAGALLERETLDAEEIKVLLEGGSLEPLSVAEGESQPVDDEASEPSEPEPSTRPEEFPRGIPPLADPDPSA